MEFIGEDFHLIVEKHRLIRAMIIIGVIQTVWGTKHERASPD